MRRLAPLAALLVLPWVAACEHSQATDAGGGAISGAPDGDGAQAPAAAPATAPDGAESGTKRPPVGLPKPALAGGQQIRITPAHPAADEAFEVRAGPITFRNGCEGIAKVEVKRAGSSVVVTWTPKQVPPDAMCTMALHDDWVTAQVDGLPAGTYTVSVNEVGEVALVVGGPPPASEGGGGAPTGQTPD